MRGESSDVIEAEAVEVSGGLSGKSATTTHSPPLSAAASQVSLATSDLTTSDPDLALESSASSFTSSRPPSSSDVISPDLGLPNVDEYTAENVVSPDEYTKENVLSTDLPIPNVDEYKTENVISTDLLSPNIDEYTENVISTDLPSLPSVDDYTTETDTHTTQSKPVRSVMAGGGASFMNELNAALHKRSHINKPEHDKTDAPDNISDKLGNDHIAPSSSLPVYPDAILDANSLSLEGKPQGVKRKYESENLPKLDFEPEVGMVVLSHQAAKHKLSVKPKRKYESHRPRKQFQDNERIILDLSVCDSNSQTFQEKDSASPVMPTSLLPSISPQNLLVDCPGSPLRQTEEGQKSTGVCFAPDIKVFAENSTEGSSAIVDESTEDASIENSEDTSEFKLGTNLLGVPPEDGPPSLGPPEGPPSLGFDVEMEDEDYFEEFHLPNTYDNAFVRHKSFRRKVNLAPIDAPDAERIEGLIVAGEFERHGSIRRKLVPEVIADENKNKLEQRLSDISSKSDNSDNDMSISSDVGGVFARDLEEIQEMLNEESNENLEDDVEAINETDDVNHNEQFSDKDISNVTSSNVHGDSEIQDSSELSEETECQLAVPKQPSKRTNTSTPKSNSSSSYTSALLDKDISSMSEGDTPDNKGEQFLSFEDENMSIEPSTLIKIQECLDFTKLQDMYSLSGRIQDILSPEEMKEVIENADRYREYINQDFIDVLNHSLSLSLQEHTIETNTDSGISSPKRTSPDVKSDLRSVFEGNNESVDEGNENESNESGHEVNEYESKENINNEDNDAVFVFERKRSLRIVKGNNDDERDEVEVEAVFVESDNSPRNMKRLAAPAIDFTAGSEDLDGSHDISVFSNEPPITDLDTPYVPNLVLTNTDGYRGEIKQDDSCSHLLLYDTPSAASEILTPLNLDSHSPSFPVTSDQGSTELNGGGQRKLICVTKDILNSPVEEDNISISSVCSEGFTHEDTIGSIHDEILGISDNGINSPRRSHGSDGFQHSSPDSQSYEEPPLPPSPYKTKGEEPIPSLPPFIPELTAMEESMEDRHWRSVVVGGSWRRIDMKVIAPYRKCLHHGGYMSENNQAIIVFSSCYLPNSSRRDYNYVMDNLFLYVLSTLEQLIADDYVLIYLAGGCPKNSVPSFKWLKRAYQMIDRKLRKNLQALHVVHPTMWVKTIVTLTRPFVSSKFYRKLSFINNLTELAQVVPLDQLEIPDTVQQHDGTRKPSILTMLTGSNPPPGRTLS